MKNIQTIELRKQSQTLYYFTQRADITNVLGKISASLTEYLVSIDEDMKTILCKLYKTSEGLWYDPIDEHDKALNRAKLAIKAAIDEKETASN